VAYAKSGPLLRLRERLEAWKKAGKTSAAIIGIDQQGTSREALELALELFDCVYTTQETGLTFHPKIYFFSGAAESMAFIGSNNLTVGGTEKNFEAGLLVEMDGTTDAAEFVDRALPVDPVVDEPRFSSRSDRRLVAVRSLP
jgi:phosphatidylserine/phosphatidylglycerophosphate/cardiolipin synthase-like enzyme